MSAPRLLLGLLLAVTSPPASGDDVPSWPWDEAIAHATLESGLRIVVVPHAGDTTRVLLLSSHGAAAAADSEAAHLAEHVLMEMDGREPAEQVVRRLGMQPGTDANALTGPDRVGFTFRLRGDARAHLPAVLALTRDIARPSRDALRRIRREAGALHAEHEAGPVERRHAFIEALAGRSGADPAMRRSKEATITTTHRLLVEILRPDRLSLAIVGDVDASATLESAVALFRDLPSAPDATDAPAPVPPGIVHVTTLPDATTRGSWADVTWSWPVAPEEGPGTLRADELLHSMVDDVAARILRARLMTSEDVASGAVEVTCSAARLPGRSAITMSAHGAIPGESERLAEWLLTELERLKRMPSSRDEVKAAFLGWYGARMSPRREGIEADRVMDHVADELLAGRPVLSEADTKASAQLVSRALPGFLVEQPFPDPGPGHLLVAIPSAESDATARLESFVRELPTRTLQPVAPSSRPPPLEAPAPGSIVEKAPRPSGEGESWTLGNGMRVVVHRPPGHARITLEAAGRGGMQTERARTLAMAAAASVATPGRDGMTSRALAAAHGSAAPVLSTTLGARHRRLSAIAGERQAGELLAELHRLFTQPPPDRDVIARRLKAAAAALSTESAAAESRLQAALFAPEWRKPSGEEMAGLTPDAVPEGWRRFFSDPASWTVVLALPEDAGDVTADVATWLASIPPAVPDPALTVADVPPILAEGPLIQVFPAGRRSRLQVALPAEVPMPLEEACPAWEVLTSRLHGILRQERGETYGVLAIDVSMDNRLRALILDADVPTDGARRSARIVLREVRRLARRAPGASELAALRMSQACVPPDHGGERWAERALWESLGVPWAPSPDPSPEEFLAAHRNAFRATAPATWITPEPAR